jgi:hypothetical protein
VELQRELSRIEKEALASNNEVEEANLKKFQLIKSQMQTVMDRMILLKSETEQ